MLLLLLILLPLAAAIFGIFTGKSRMLALFINAAGLLLSIYLAWQTSTTGSILSYSQAWLPEMNVNFSLKADGLSMVMVLLTFLIGTIVCWSSLKWKYENEGLFFGLLMIAISSLVGVFLAGDIFLFYFFFEIALIPVFIMALKWGGANSSQITFKMLAYTIFGSLLMLVAMVFYYSKTQTSDLSEMKAAAAFIPLQMQENLMLAFLLAFAIKMPLFPFHTWQADTYEQSPTPATMLLSGLLSKMGVYGLIRIVVPLLPLALADLGVYISFIAVVGLLYGSIAALRQDSAKRLVAYSSFAHMGLMAAAAITAGTEGLQGAVYQMFAHGINVVGLFLVLKIVFEKTGLRKLSDLGGLSQSAPVLSICAAIILLGSVALPLTNGFIGEFLMLKGLYDYNNWLGILAGISIILGAAYMLRMYQKTFFETAKTQITDVSGNEKYALIFIAVLVLVMGLFPNMILKLTEPSIGELLTHLK